MSDFLVEWESGVLSVAWQIKHGLSVKRLQIPRAIYAFLPKHIRGFKARSRFNRLASLEPFRGDWKAETGAGDHEFRRFLLRFPSGVWDHPWELLIAEVDELTRGRISIVRAFPESPNGLPSKFDRPMSILCIQGDDGSKTRRNPLDLRREAESLLKVYDSLPEASRSAILRPRICQPQTKEELSRFLSDPADIVFFSGHASSNPPLFFLLDGSSFSPSEIRDTFSKSAARPIFVAFWACNTARNPEKDRGGPGPDFYLSLSEAGVASVLAMQATISDKGATLLAREVFQGLASGDSLDIAAARARAALMNTLAMGDADRLDWACPVVWSSGLTGASLQWNAPSSELAHLQIANRRARIAREARTYSAPTEEEIASARKLLGIRLNWMKNSGLAADRERWIRLLTATETIQSRYIVAIELDHNLRLTDELRLWAEELNSMLEMSNANGYAFRSALELIQRRPETGWAQLCASGEVLISIWRPPSYRADMWFWEPILRGTMPAIIMGDIVTNQLVTDGWGVEQSDMPIDEQFLSAAHDEAPMVSNALALLETPVPETSLSVLGFELNQKAKIEELLIRTDAREVILTSPAQRQFRACMDDGSRVEAHKACMMIYDHVSFAGRLTPAIRERRLSHCLGANESEAAREEIGALLATYREANRPQAVVSLMKRVGKLWEGFPEHFLIRIAWAYTMLSEITQAEFWLNRSGATEPLEEAWQYGLWAEIHKAHGDKQAALDAIDNAISVMQRDSAASNSTLAARILRAYRQDRARILQYLFYDATQAAEEYIRLVEEWKNETNAAIDLATVLRNYSECIRTGHQPADREWRQAKDMLDQAAALLQYDKNHPVYPEIEYEKARVALLEGDKATASVLLDQAKSDALAAGHLMLATICVARKFWEFEAFDSDRWDEIAANLSAFPRHGWAVRTLIDGRLRAAKRTKDPTIARQSLASNIDDLNRNPSFCAGSDRYRIAASAAGYSVLSNTGIQPRPWEEFLARSWSKEWLQSNQFQSPEDVWRSVS